MIEMAVCIKSDMETEKHEKKSCTAAKAFEQIVGVLYDDRNEDTPDGLIYNDQPCTEVVALEKATSDNHMAVRDETSKGGKDYAEEAELDISPP